MKSNWEFKKIGEICLEIKSGFACGKQNEVASGIKHLRTNNINTDGNLSFEKIVQIPENLVDKNAFGLETGDIIFNNTNSTELVGKSALITGTFQYAFSNHITRIRVDKNKILPEWLAFNLQLYWRQKYFEKICTRWVGLPIPLLQEQQKIVEQLDSISEKINQLQEYQRQTSKELELLEQSVLQKAMSGELTT